MITYSPHRSTDCLANVYKFFSDSDLAVSVKRRRFNYLRPWRYILKGVISAITMILSFQIECRYFIFLEFVHTQTNYFYNISSVIELFEMVYCRIIYNEIEEKWRALISRCHSKRIGLLGWSFKIKTIIYVYSFNVSFIRKIINYKHTVYVPAKNSMFNTHL